MAQLKDLIVNGVSRLLNKLYVDDQIVSSIATGTAPLSITSTTQVNNLNVDLLDGQHGSYYRNAGNINAGTIAFARLPSMYWANVAVASSSSTATTPQFSKVYVNGSNSSYNLYVNGASYFNGNTILGAASTSSNHTLTVNGKVVINPSYNTASNSFNEGVIINQASNSWAEIVLGGANGYTAGGIAAGHWLIARRGAAGSYVGAVGDFNIGDVNEQGGGLTLHKNNGGATIYANCGQDVGTLNLRNINSLTSGTSWPLNAVMPNMSAGTSAVLLVGQGNSSRNGAYIGFKYSSSGSNDNYLKLGLYGADDLMIIKGSGNVGIGTVSPRCKLDINGPLIIDTSNASSYTNFNEGIRINKGFTNPLIHFGGTGKQGTGSGQYSIGLHGTIWELTQNSWSNCIISATTDNYVGIGTASPAYRFHVNGNSYFSDLITASNGNHKGILVGNTYITAINKELILQNNDAIRFGTDAWNYDQWAGLKYVHDPKAIYLGLADGTVFTANSAQSGGILYLPGIRYFSINGKTAIDAGDNWLRINQDLAFSNGIYTGSSLIRSDNQLQVGSGGNAFYANSSGNGYFSNTLGVAGTNTSYKLYVNGVSYINAASSYSANKGLTINNGILQISNYGYNLFVGNQNSAYTHFETNCSQFYFNTQLAVNGHIYPYLNNTYNLGTSVNKWYHAYIGGNIYGGTFTAVHLGGQGASYRHTVIALCRVSTTNNAPYNSFSAGDLYFHRSNGLYGMFHLKVTAEDRYAEGSGFNFSYEGDGELNEGMTKTSGGGFRPCVFKYNDIWYGGIYYYWTAAEVSDVSFIGRTNDVIPFQVHVYQNNNSSILNSEIYDSINFSTYVISNSFHTHSLISKNGTFKNLAVINDSSDTSYDALAYFRHYNSSDWGIIVDKNNSYDYGLNIKTSTSSTYGLQTNGQVIINSTCEDYREGIRLRGADGAWNTIILGATSNSGTNTNAWSIHRKPDNNFCISRNSSDGANGLVMTSTGMGLGTTSPSYRLDVSGMGRFTNTLLLSSMNNVALNFRPDSSTYYTTVSYQTAGNEALVFATKQSVTSFIFYNGEDSTTNHGSDRWYSLISGIQIKQNCLSVGSGWGQGVTPDYKLKVGGNSQFGGSIFFQGGDGTLKIYQMDGGQSTGNETIALQSCFDGADPETHSYVTSYPGRCVIALQPRGGRVAIGRNTASYALHVTGDIYANGGWLRSSGTAGWYSESYGGGWYMEDSTYIRAYNGKKCLASGFYHSGYGSSAYALTSDGGVAHIGSMSVNNADLLDSQHGSYYQNASNLNAGTVPNARFPARLQEYNTSAVNDATKNGWYYGTSNSPFTSLHTSATDFMYLANGYSTVWASEIATDFRSNRLAVRNKNNGSWNSWVRLLDQNTGVSRAHYGTTGSCSYVLVTINKATGWMLNFTLKLYQGYTATDIQISGYNYGSNHWYSPQSRVISSTSSGAITVYFGYTSDYNLWVAVPGASYTGADIVDPVNGYNQISLDDAFTITGVSSLPGTTQTTQTIYRPWYRDETVSYSSNASNIYVTGNSGTNYLVGVSAYSSAYQQGHIYSPFYWSGSRLYGTYMSINGGGTSYPLQISGDTYTTGWSRAGNGFYIQDTGVHYTHSGSIGEIDIQNSNEFLLGASGSTLYFNYRAVSRGTTVTNFIWNAGSSTTYASHTMGAITAKATFYAYPSPSSWLNGQKTASSAGISMRDATDTDSYWPWIRQTNTSSSKWFSIGTLNSTLYIIGSSTSRTENSYDYGFTFNISNGQFAATKVYGAVWNDYAEYRKAATKEPGKCVIENGNDTLSLSTSRLQRGAEIISDTFGFAIGETEQCKTPIATTGRVLAYGYESREEFKSHIGYPVCSGPNGTVSIMTEEEEKLYPSRIIGFVSAVPDYKEWGSGNVKVNGRIWIRVR